MVANIPKPPPFEVSVFSEVLEYRDGRLFFLRRGSRFFKHEAYAFSWNLQFAGKEAFLGVNKGYRVGSVLGIRLKAHHVVWSLFNGWPISEIDHIDRDRSNNKIDNLRLSNSISNSMNRSIRSDNTTGLAGIQLKPNGSYEARAFGKYVGRSKTLEGAIQMREQKLRSLSHV